MAAGGTLGEREGERKSRTKRSGARDGDLRTKDRTYKLVRCLPAALRSWAACLCCRSVCVCGSKKETVSEKRAGEWERNREQSRQAALNRRMEEKESLESF